MKKKMLIAGAVGAAFVGGTLFGQLPGALAGHTQPILDARLFGSQEVPGPGDPDGRGTAVVFGVDDQPDTVCYVVRVTRIQLGTTTEISAHIHEAPRGEAGDVVAALAPPTDGDSAGCVVTEEAQDILTNPNEYYVNVHNPEYPAGAVRGQLNG